MGRFPSGRGAAPTYRAPAIKFNRVGRSCERPIERTPSNSDPRVMSFLLALAILLLALWQPVEFGVSELTPPVGPDYGIFDSISELHGEMDSRVDDPEVLVEVERKLGPDRRTGYEFEDISHSDFPTSELEVQEPIKKSPVIFDALQSNPIINNTELLDWLMPPPLGDQGAINYLVMFHGVGGNSFHLGSMIPRIGLFTDSSLDKWIYIDADWNPDTGDSAGNDIRARLTFARDLLERDWEVTLIPPTLKLHNAGLRMEVESLFPVNGSSGISGIVYFVKSISYEGRNYLWSIGINMDEVMDRLELSLRARIWTFKPSLEAVQGIISGGKIDWRDLNILEILGPFTISYDFDTPPDWTRVSVSVIRVYEKTLVDRAFLELQFERDVSHSKLIESGRLILYVKNMGSPIDGVGWEAGPPEVSSHLDTIKLNLRYVEFGEHLMDGALVVPVLPHRLCINITAKSEQGRNVSVIDINTPDGVTQLDFIDAIYENWKGNTTLPRPNSTMFSLKGIPPHVHVESTTALPFDIEEGNASGLGSNMLDVFMSQFSSRFYRIGRLLKEVPQSVFRLPSDKGWSEVDCGGDAIYSAVFRSTYDIFVNSTGNTIAFRQMEDGRQALSASIYGLMYMRSTYLDVNEISLSVKEAPSLSIAALSDEGISLLMLEEAPTQITLRTSDTGIDYTGMRNNTPAILGAMKYRYRDPGLRLDLNVFDVPSTLHIKNEAELKGMNADQGEIGSLELFSSNSTDLLPPDIPERSFASTLIEGGKAALGLRINRLRSLEYSNGSVGHFSINTSGEANFHMMIEDRDLGLDLRAVIAPLPGSIRMELPTFIDRPDFSFPNLTGIESITGYGDMLIGLGMLGGETLHMASQLSRGLSNTIGKYSRGLSMSWDLSEKRSNMDLIMEVEKRGAWDIPEPHWTHGIWMEQSGSGENGSMKGRIYLQGLPTRGEMNLSFSEETISASLDMDGYRPDFQWMLINTAGVQDRDISLYITGIRKGINLTLDVQITTDLSIGGEIIVNLEVNANWEDGRPVDLGPMITTLRKKSPILSVRQMYLPEVPSRIRLTANVGEGVSAYYEASKRIESIYFKVTKLLDGRWSQIYAVFHDLPEWFQLSVKQNTDFSIQEPFVLQGLPELTVKTSSDDMDIFIEYDGSGFGQRGRYQLYAIDIGDTETGYDGEWYEIDSEGVGYLSIEIGRLPVLDSFTLDSLAILGSDVEHISISSEMVFGAMPTFEARDAKGGAFQVRLSGEFRSGDTKLSSSFFFTKVRKRDILGIPYISSVSVTRDTFVIDLESEEDSTVMPAPILTFWAGVWDSIFGGD